MCGAIRPSAPLGVVMTTNRPLHCHRDDDSDDINKDGANVDNEHKGPVVVIGEK